ncbi:MAG: hypothetical protein JRD04_02200 [Deltaproteobacteria bacterium]|nr:hypothetical protein [Deltaproteobacteria bacterium]
MNANYRYKPESFLEWITLEEPKQADGAKVSHETDPKSMRLWKRPSRRVNSYAIGGIMQQH